MNKILVVAPHPDDESIGCAGTLLNHIDSGDEVYWLIMTKIRVEKGWSEKKITDRTREIDLVSKTYPITEHHILDFDTTELDAVENKKIIDKISPILKKINPTIVYLPFYGDVHTDHQVTFNLMLSCTKNFRYPSIRKILMYETLSETEFSNNLRDMFIPNVYIDISKNFSKKIEILNIYKSELMDEPLPRSLRSIESLAAYRGSRIGVNFAEAFSLILEIK